MGHTPPFLGPTVFWWATLLVTGLSCAATTPARRHAALWRAPDRYV